MFENIIMYFRRDCPATCPRYRRVFLKCFLLVNDPLLLKTSAKLGRQSSDVHQLAAATRQIFSHSQLIVGMLGRSPMIWSLNLPGCLPIFVMSLWFFSCPWNENPMLFMLFMFWNTVIQHTYIIQLKLRIVVSLRFQLTPVDDSTGGSPFEGFPLPFLLI